MYDEPRTNVRVGKIAALPGALREELNCRLTDGQLSEQLLPWLNGLPEVRRLLDEHFHGRPVLRQNLSAWICGGYQDWLRARQQADATRKLVEYTLEQAKTNHRSVTEEAAELAASMLVELLGQMSRAFSGAKQMAAGQSALGALRGAFGPAGEPGSDQSSVISNQSSVNGGSTPPTDHWSDNCPPSTDDCSLMTDNSPPASSQRRKESGNAQVAGREQYTLSERLGLLARAVAGLTQLRKREQADEAMELKRERLKQTGEMVALHRERLKLQARIHEEKLAWLKASRDSDLEGEWSKGRIPTPEDMELLCKDINL